GFAFTSVAVSGGIGRDGHNCTRYIFAVDPERAHGCHLYNVWTRLQTAEVHALRSRKFELAEGHRARAEFHDRAGELGGLFDDPWYDGHNYRCAIVDTPNRGTFIGPSGVRSDLADDCVAMLVAEELELSCFASDVAIV